MAPTKELAATAAEALPFAVTAVTVFAILAPLLGPRNVTVTPESSTPPASFTSTTKGAAKVAPVVDVWEPPEIGVIVAGIGADPVLVNRKVAGVAKLAGPTPAAEAVTG